MKRFTVSNSSLFPLCSLGFALGLVATTTACQGSDGPGSDDLLPDNVVEQCGFDLNCEAGGFAEGKASISGIGGVDAFFGAAIDLDASMRGLSADLRAELDAIALSIGLSRGASGADIAMALEVHLSTYIGGDLQVVFQPARCTANIEASVAAAAECDAEVTPGSVTVRCEGSCAVDVEGTVGCEGDAKLICIGTAPQLDCGAGTCSGSCSVDVSSELDCDGTCRGSCEVEGNTMDGFEGRCNGECTGECVTDLSAGGSCMGRCEGQCEYEAPDGASCEGAASAKCEASAGASIECDAGCEGTAEPPSVTAECEATVEAKADASLECVPPSVDIGFTFSGDAEASAELRAEFRAWLAGFRAHIGAIVAMRAKAEVINDSAVKLVAAADGVVRDTLEELLGERVSLKAIIGAGCALQELPVAAGGLQDSSANLAAEVSATADVFAAIGRE